MAESSYGTQFLQHLQAIGRTTPYSYEDVQLIKTMTQQELAEKLRTQFRAFSDIILANDPKTAAECVHQKSLEITNASANAAGIAGLSSVGELFASMLQVLASTS